MLIMEPSLLDTEEGRGRLTHAYIQLLVDAGWNLIPGGAFIHAFGGKAIAVSMAIAEKVAPGAMIALKDTAGSVVKAATHVGHYVQQVPGVSNAAGMVSAVNNTASGLARAMTYPLGAPLAATAGAIDRAIFSRFQKRVSAEAFEGLSYLTAHGCANSAEKLLNDGFSHEVIEKTLEIARHLDFELYQFSDDAIRGLAAAVESGPLGASHVIELISRAANYPDTIERALRNAIALRSTAGLANWITALRDNASREDTLEGIVYEGTCARRIAAGELPGSGPLEEIGVDADQSVNKIDIFSGHFGVQAKHVMSGQPFQTWQLVGFGGDPEQDAMEYLNTFVEQNILKHRQPVWITNGGLSPEFDALLDATERKFAEDGVAVRILRITLPSTLP